MTRLNLADDLKASSHSSPDAAVLIYEGRRIRYGDLETEANRVAAGLSRLGVRKGDRVAFAIGNRPVFAAVHYGTMRAGAVSVPLNPGLRAAELRSYLGSVSPRVIVADEDVVNEIMAAGPHSAPVFVIGKHSTARPFDQLLSDGEPPSVETTADDLAVLAYTSGASGSPKAAMLTHGNLDANLRQMLQIPRAKTEPDDVVLGVLPPFHIFALNVVLGLSVRQGASVLLLTRFDPVASMQQIAANGVTIIVGAPPMFVSWLMMPDPEKFDLSTVRFAISGASAIPAEVITAFKSTFGIEIWEGYGLTETSPTVATTRMADQLPGSVGKPLPDLDLRIVDPSGLDSAPGDVGEIYVRGPNVFSGYWGDEEASRSVFSGDWFRTGDMGYFDEAGYLWLVDRKKELIIVSGFNVYPKEVEDAICTHPAVREAAVIGMPHPRQGESVKAFVIPGDGQKISEQDVIVHCARRLARFKVPAEVEIVDTIPSLPSGKVLKRLLRPNELGSNG